MKQDDSTMLINSINEYIYQFYALSQLLYILQNYHYKGIVMGNKAATFCSNNNFNKSKTTHEDEYVKYALCHMKGWRQFMEDATIHINDFPAKNHYLFGVFDGHGGPQVAQYVQRHFSIELYLNQQFKNRDYVSSLVETFNKMDHILQSQAGRKEIASLIKHNISIENRYSFLGDMYAGCTANVCLITDKEIYVANAGDSRAVACCKGSVVPLSFDHKPEDHNQQRRITSAGGSVTNGRINQALNISRSIGDMQFKKNKSLTPSQQMVTSTPDVLKCSREGIQFIIMGCDGIWQRKSNEQMVQWIGSRLKRNLKPVDILSELLDEQLASNEQEYNGTDNMSAILIVFKK